MTQITGDKPLHFMVQLGINYGMYEKVSHTVVTNIPPAYKEYAFEFACTREAHNEITFSDDTCNDGDGEFMYQLYDNLEVSDEELITLKKFCNTENFNIDDLKGIDGLDIEA